MSEALAIKVAGVSKRYPGRQPVHALRGVDLEVAPGEIYGLLGRNGAGKTTLVKILLDIVRPTKGTTSLLGISSRLLAARKSVGYLPEDHRFPEYQTAETAMEYYARLSDVPADVRRKEIPRLLDLVGLTAAAKRKVRGFSKGMKQRLGLAQALVHDPKVLFLDEPTDGVDPQGRAEIRDLLVQVRDEGRTIFLNSHLLSEVEQICDRVGILDQGLLTREGTIDELTHKEDRWSLELDRIATPELLEALRAFASSVRPSGRQLEIYVTEESQIDAVVDGIRAQGIGLRALSGGRATLEEVFLETIHTEEAPS